MKTLRCGKVTYRDVRWKDAPIDAVVGTPSYEADHSGALNRCCVGSLDWSARARYDGCVSKHRRLSDREMVTLAETAIFDRTQD